MQDAILSARSLMTVARLYKPLILCSLPLGSTCDIPIQLTSKIVPVFCMMIETFNIAWSVTIR